MGEEMVNQIKTLQELNLLDRFLFSEVMVDNETLEDVLEMKMALDIISKATGLSEQELNALQKRS
ncbi:MAG: hypothetical protein SPH11_08420 [Lentihominibacter sp.]|uniref:hypothetical protein n=1 Tax=Lentihominibacter sp. TaxID=2944216 RepID=UPI002A90DC12|nr:hypothetical protein [Lentihominibacter sp.]MDY5287756.1 hypothetical protein [Lentihominibacter sp.]